MLFKNTKITIIWLKIFLYSQTQTQILSSLVSFQTCMAYSEEYLKGFCPCNENQWGPKHKNPINFHQGCPILLPEDHFPAEFSFKLLKYNFLEVSWRPRFAGYLILCSLFGEPSLWVSKRKKMLCTSTPTHRLAKYIHWKNKRIFMLLLSQIC